MISKLEVYYKINKDIDNLCEKLYDYKLITHGSNFKQSLIDLLVDNTKFKDEDFNKYKELSKHELFEELSGEFNEHRDSWF